MPSFPPRDIQAQHAALCRDIQAHDHRYYLLNQPSISDQAYDTLFNNLKELESRYPALVHPASPTQRVGEMLSGRLPVVKHAARMYSLDNTYNPDELREFDTRVRKHLGELAFDYVVEPKVDGASVELIYRQGELSQALTRGDGEFGDDITHTIRTIRSLPLRLPQALDLTLRGEVYIWRQDLAAINQARQEQDESPFANPRNAAAGTLRMLDPSIAAARALRCVLYESLESLGADTTHAALLESLRALNLPTQQGHHQVCASVDAALEVIEAFNHSRHALPYDTDGVVLKVNQRPLRERLGATARHYRWAIAYKYPAAQVHTQVIGIDYDVGRSGVITPVSLFDAVQLQGTTVEHASLHNVDYIRSKDIRVGDTVVIEKAGEIIPQVIAVDLSQRPAHTLPWTPPTQCPACGAPLERIEGEAALRCRNHQYQCPGQLKAALWYFTRRGSMDIEGLGKQLIAQLVEQGLLRHHADIFRLPAQREALLQLERMGAKSVDNLIKAIDASKEKRSFAALLTGLGIPLVGQSAADLIAQQWPRLGALLDAMDKDTLRSTLEPIAGIGPKLIDSLERYLKDPIYRAVLDELVSLGVEGQVAPKAPRLGNALEGLSFCITGTLSEARQVIQQRIQAQGGLIHSNLSKQTRYLVCGDKVGASKRKKAEQYGTEILDETALQRMLQS